MSTRFCFIHAADLHLDSPFTGIGRTAPPVAEALREASLEAYDRLIQLAIEREAAFLLLAGDIYDGPERGLRAQLRFLAGIERLREAGIRVFAVDGNHDAAAVWSAVREMPENYTMFGSEGVGMATVDRAGERLANVYGISYGAQQVTENLALRFQRLGEPGLHIGLLHCAVGTPEGGSYSPTTVRDLANAGMDYWALGHAHDHRILGDGKPWIVYPGTPQGRGTRAGEWWAKGVVAVDAEDGQIQRVDFVPVDSVRVVEARIDIEGVADVASLEKRILGEARQARDAQERGVVLRVTLVGRGAVHHDLQADGRVEDLTADVRMLTGEDERMLWIDQIVDESLGLLDRDSIAQRGDFSSDLLRRAEELRTSPELLADLMGQTLEPLRGARFRRWLDPDVWDPLAVVAEAERKALDLVESGGRQ